MFYPININFWLVVPKIRATVSFKLANNIQQAASIAKCDWSIIFTLQCSSFGRPML